MINPSNLNSNWYAGIVVVIVLFASTIKVHGQSTELPANFVGNRISLHPITDSGDTLTLYTDTGGASIISKDLVNKYDLHTEKIKVNNRTLDIGPFPNFKNNVIPNIPIKKASVDAPSIQEDYIKLNNRYYVHAFTNKMGDGILGQEWFATRIWTLDYLNQKLILHDVTKEWETSSENRALIYFKEDSVSRHKMHFPRIQAEICGDTLNFLMNSGATLELKDMVQLALDDGLPQVRGTSFITRSQFEEWYFEHPEWTIYEDVEEGQTSNMIRVPEITVAGHTVGPVWFTTRPDNYFHKEMTRYVDQKIDGSLGGSFFKYFQVTINYPEEYSIFKLSN